MFNSYVHNAGFGTVISGGRRLPTRVRQVRKVKGIMLASACDDWTYNEDTNTVIVSFDVELNEPEAMTVFVSTWPAEG